MQIDKVQSFTMRLFRRSNGNYYIAFERGKERSLKTSDPLLAQRLFKKAERAALAGRLVQLDRAQNTPLGDFAKEYVSQREKEKTWNTARIDRESFDKLRDFIGDAVSIQSFTRKSCDEFIAHLRKDLQPTTVNIAIRHLKTAFKKAIDWEYIDKSPWERIKQIPIKDALPRALNREEVERLLNVIDSPEFKEMVYTYLYTGGRRTEIARLQWPDVKDGLITLRETKTKVRVVPLAANLAAILLPRRKDIGPVFPHFYSYPKEASKSFRRFADNVGLKGVKLHDLRHTSATFMILNGVPIKIVAEILGHSSVRTTEIYTKLIVENCRDGINTLNF